MRLDGTSALRLRPGDFGVRLAGERLEVPAELGRVLRDCSIDTAEEFLAYLTSFPTIMAAALQWTLEDLDRAHQRLVNELRGHVDEELLSPATPEERGYGALDPADLKHRLKQR
jgi:hypothetical protein